MARRKSLNSNRCVAQVFFDDIECKVCFGIILPGSHTSLQLGIVILLGIYIWEHGQVFRFLTVRSFLETSVKIISWYYQLGRGYSRSLRGAFGMCLKTITYPRNVSETSRMNWLDYVDAIRKLQGHCDRGFEYGELFKKLIISDYSLSSRNFNCGLLITADYVL